MIINCPYCEKKFQISNDLIPSNGRLLQCGSCKKSWFFKPKNITENVEDITCPECQIGVLNYYVLTK